MEIGSKVTIKGSDPIWEGKQGLVEDIDEVNGTCTVFVDFDPENNRKVRQDFPMEALAITESIQEGKVAEDIYSIDTEDEAGVVKALAEYFSVDEEDVHPVRDHEYEIEGATYWVGSQDEAEEHAHEECMDLIDDMGLESFSKDYQEYILNDARFFDYDTVRGWMHESYEGYVQDIEDEEDEEFGSRLIQEMHQVGILTDDDFEEVDGVVDHEQLKDSVDLDDKKQQYVDYLCEDVDPVEWLKGIYSEKELAKLVAEQGLIDWDRVADDCIETDGLAHYIASYDGEEVQITPDLSAFRID